MWKKVSGGLRQPQKLRGGLAPIGIDQPRLEQVGAVAEITSGYCIAAPGCREGHAPQTAGLRDDAAGLGVGRGRVLPEHDPGPDLTGKDKAQFVVLNDHDAGAKAQRIALSNAEITARNALAGDDQRLFGGLALADDERAVEAADVIAFVIAGDTDAGDAQRQLLGMTQPGQDLSRDNFADRGESGVVGKALSTAA